MEHLEDFPPHQSLLESGSAKSYQSVASSSDGSNECCSTHSSAYKATVLFLICTLTLGSYFSYDNPGALGDEFKTELAQNSTSKRLLMYSVYSWPNVLLPFAGGAFIDHWLGVRTGSLICSILVAAGVCIVAVASTLDNSADSTAPFILALLGRTVFGLGGECLTVTQNIFCSKWFRGKSMALAFAIVLSFSRVGGAINFAVMQPISDGFGFQWALWVSTLLTCFSLLACIALGYMDRRGERTGAVQSALSGEDASLSLLFEVLKPEPLLIYLICVCFYGAVLTFMNTVVQFFKTKYGINESYIASLPYTVSACVSPILGLTLDRVGYPLTFVMVASVSLVCVHVSLAATEIMPQIAMVWLGLTYSLCAAALWPMLSFVVSDRLLGTGYGLMTALQNLGLATVPIVVGRVLGDCPEIAEYEKAEWIFSGLAAMAVICSIALFFIDRVNGGVLNASPKAIAEHNTKEARAAREAIAQARRMSNCESPFTLKTPEMLRRQFYRKLDAFKKNAPMGM